jgi:DNA-binding response OmpR family regulator
MHFKNIMIVEDEQLNILFIEASLAESDYDNIWSYNSSEEAIKAINEGTVPDLILMDINLGKGKDGLFTASKIKQRHKDIPIVFMSAYNDVHILEEVLSISLYGFISKPFNERTLQIAIELAQRNFIKNQKELSLKKYIKLSKNASYDLEHHNIIEDNEIISIPIKQKNILKVLIKSMNNTVDKAQLSFEIWPDTQVSDSSLRTLIYLLKKRFEGIPIYTHSKEGYIFKYAI